MQQPGSDSTGLIALEKVGKVYDAGGSAPVVALDGIDVEIRGGEFVAIMGPSGSGKSTLLNLMGALDAPTSGRVLVDGHDTATLDDQALTRLRRERLGFVFQFFNLLPLLTATENAALPLLLGGQKMAVAEERAKALLEQVGLSKRATHRPDALSGGERQRLAVARALAARPQFILADEPTGNLDRSNGESILDLFAELIAHDGVGMVMVTHDPLAARRASRVIEIVDGKIQAAS